LCQTRDRMAPVKRTDSGQAKPGKSQATGAPKKRPRGAPPPKGPKPARAPKAEVDARVATVLGLIVDGVCRRRQIMQTLARAHIEGKIGWGPKMPGGQYARPDDAAFEAQCVSVRTVDLYIARATSELQAIADEPRSLAKAKVRARYERAIAGAMADKQWDTVRKVARDMARLDGLEPGTRHIHEGNVGATVSGQVEHIHRPGGTLEERASAVTDLLGRAASRRAAQLAAAAGQN
jgi:hypothetical protein